MGAKMIMRLGFHSLTAALRRLGSLGLFVSAVEYLLLIQDTSPAYDRPIQSSAIACLIIGLLLLFASWKLPGILGTDDHGFHHHSDANSPLKYKSSRDSSRPPSSNSADSSSESGTRSLVLHGLTIAFAICIRIEATRRTFLSRQCAVVGLEGLLPGLLSGWTYFRATSKESLQTQNVRSFSGSSYLLIGFLSHNAPLLCMALSTVWAAQLQSLPQSSVICFISDRKTVIWFQCFGVAIDLFLILAFDKFLNLEKHGKHLRASQRLFYTSFVFLLSSTFLTIAGFVTHLLLSNHWSEVMIFDWEYIGLLFAQSFILVIIVIGTIRLHVRVGVKSVVLVVFSVQTYHNILMSESRAQVPFLPSLPIKTLIATALWFVSTAYALCVENNGPDGDDTRLSLQRIPITRAVLLALLTLKAVSGVARTNLASPHPINQLIVQASSSHTAWLAQVNRSCTLGAAVQEYERRYNRNPPPNFDKWYSFASTRFSAIIDDFDKIHDDLLPFWALKPQILRNRTREILSDPWNEVAEVRIRSGHAEIVESIWPTHKWMLEGAVNMMNTFAEWLPDMDLAFNVNDEPRVTIPYEQMQMFRKIEGESVGIKRISSMKFSADALARWPTKNHTLVTRDPFQNLAFVPSFHMHGSIACPPLTLARQRPKIVTPNRLCTSCLFPHSTGTFLSDYTLSGSPCHQPDLAHLHGLYLSPASFKVTHTLVPIFSQSKPHGFADILYPSPWNYLDKVKYAPPNSTDDLPLHKKKNTLYWRGATSEGVSVDGSWKGMTRQRLVNMASKTSSAWTKKVPVLLPSLKKDGEFSYQYLSPEKILAHPSLAPSNLSADVAFVDGIARCRGADCEAQARHFALAPPADFQSHWRYRFLLDLDGAGFSGRFLPFLVSRSLPFKAGIMREWWEGRIAAWKHFVPLDVRGVGLWSTLAYFGGGGMGEVEAERMAEEGRRWAQRVLRKEDMEVYFFRLLLEWGRLVDDARGDIGFAVD